MLAHAGATVAATGRDTLTVSGLAAEKIVALLGESGVPFSEVSRAPRDAGGGLHGAHQGRGRVPRRTPPGQHEEAAR